MAALEDFYDNETWEAIDGWGRRTASAGSCRRPSEGESAVDGRLVGGRSTGETPASESSAAGRPVGERLRTRTAGAAMAGALFTGASDMFEPPTPEPDEEFRPEQRDTRLQPVTYLHAPGHPEESIAIVRPWLF